MEPLAGGRDGFPIHHGELLRVEVDKLSRSILFVSLQTVCPPRELLREGFLGLGQMPQPVLHLPVAMIDAWQIHEYLELRPFDGAVDGGTGDAVVGRQFSNGVPFHPTPVELSSQMRKEFGIFMHETRVENDLWVTPQGTFSPGSLLCSKTY